MKIELTPKEISYILLGLMELEETYKFLGGFGQKTEKEIFTSQLEGKAKKYY